jgi:hypothetical protein
MSRVRFGKLSDEELDYLFEGDHLQFTLLLNRAVQTTETISCLSSGTLVGESIDQGLHRFWINESLDQVVYTVKNETGRSDEVMDFSHNDDITNSARTSPIESFDGGSNHNIFIES